MNTEDQAGILAVDAYRRIAESLILGFAACEDEGWALTDVQKVQLLSSAVQSMDGHEAMVASGMRFDEALTQTVWRPLIPEASRERTS